jgi:glycine cleavage system H protein
MENPKELKYTKEHEWAGIKGDIATIGITYYAQEQLTDVVFVELPEKGKHITQFKPMAVVESVKSVSDVFAPLSGEIIEINENLKASPELLNNSPFNDGWIVKVKIEDKNEIKNLMSAEEYERLIKKG